MLVFFLLLVCYFFLFFFFFNDTATTEIYTLSLHDALPISADPAGCSSAATFDPDCQRAGSQGQTSRSEEHTSELQSLAYLVCRLLLEKKKKNKQNIQHQKPTFIYPYSNTTITNICFLHNYE